MDKCFPVGLRSASFFFNHFADALVWILRNNYGLHWRIYYLDDYFVAGPPESSLCGVEMLGIPVAMDKVEGPSTVLIFLGLELVSVK